MKNLLIATFSLFLLASTALNTFAQGVDPDKKHITISLQVEPPSLDSSLTEDVTSGSILRLTNEGLTRIDRRGRVEAATAISWELREHDATFMIRPGAVWANGTPVTAHDFVFAFRRMVNPETGASGSAFFAYVFENGEAILRGEKPPEALGVTAISDKELHIKLSRPIPYLTNVLAGASFLPINEAFYKAQNGRFGADAVNILSNGPFIMDAWVHNSNIKFRKNPRFWNASAIDLQSLDVGYITSDVRSLLNLYKSHELAMLNLNEEILGDAMAAGQSIKRNPTSCLAWIWLNLQPGRVTANKKVREAIRLAFDRDRYINTIVGLPGTRKINSVFTKRIDGVKRNFQREYPAQDIEFNISKARGLLAEARAEMGVDTIPPIVLLANETRQIEAEFLQAQLGSALGIEIRVDKQTFKQALAKMTAGDYDIARAGFCGGAIKDPVFFAGVFYSTSPYNDAGFNNPEYDRLMDVTHSSADQKVRMDAFGQMQQLLYEDIPIIPSHESSNVYLEHPSVSGILRYPLVDFSRGRIN